MKSYVQVVLAWLFLSGMPAWARTPVPIDLRTEQARAATVEALAKESAARKREALSAARARGWEVRGVTPAGRVFELMSLNAFGRPMYYITCNATAAVSTAASLVRETSPYNVNGSNLIVGIWDAGTVRTNHQEFVSPSRVVSMDAYYADDHATHVGGTIGAKGHVAAAKGMAPAVIIHSYDWNDDLSQMAAAAANGPNQSTNIYVSNHSYGYLTGWEYGNYSGYNGWHWFGYALADREDRAFGMYDEEAREWDNVCRQAPYYLPFVAAGNDRNDGTPSSGTTFRFNGTNYTYNSSIHPYSDNHKQGGYNTVSFMAVSKNVMTIGAVNDAISGGVRNSANATMSEFSCWGPADDGRIKPDIVANGVGVYSSSAGGTGTYSTKSGTSMASPNAAGSALLLIEYYRKTFPTQDMRAATLKGLIIHTADDLGTPGPDYVFGWGLMNTKAAADHILYHYEKSNTYSMIEDTLTTANNTKTYDFLWDGSNAIRATLSWTDPEGTAQSGLNSTNRNLVNDLDVRVIAPDGTTNQPYVLDRSNPTNAATFGDNQLDNVEQVYIAHPGAAGSYTLRVTYKGTLSGGQQDYSVLLSGTTEQAAAPPINNLVWDAIASPQYTNFPFTTTITATDVGSATATGFFGTAELSGYVTTTGAVGASELVWEVPLSTYWESGRAQSIYLQGELGGAKRLNGLGLNIYTIPPEMLMNWTIRIKHTTNSAFATPSFDGPDTGWTTVYQYNSLIASTGWVLFAFTTPFDYNGTNNVMMDFSFYNEDWSSNGWVYASTGSSRTVYSVADRWEGYGDPLNWSGTENPETILAHHIPDIRFRAEQPVAVSPTETGAFTNGVWSGPITVHERVTGLCLRAKSGAVTGDSNPFDVAFISSSNRLLTITSTYGTPAPGGVIVTNKDSVVSAAMAGSPVSAGDGIQYECIGASVSGHDFTQVTPTNLTLTITNDTTIAWQWRTNYWIATSAGPNGTVNVPPGWKASGVTTMITATADAYYHFTNWTGDVSGGQEMENPLNLLVSAPMAMQANFSLNMTTSAPVAVPELWLAGHGWMENFEAAVLEDTDDDGAVNWEEYVADTDPTNANSVLRMEAETAAGPGYLVRWHASTARTYALYMGAHHPGLVTNALFTGWQPDETGTTTYTDTVHSIERQIYYRVKVALPGE